MLVAVPPVVALTVAGSDSGGGAGIEADLRTFAALGVHGAVALTAVTAQNTYEVRAVCALEPEMVRAQVEAVVEDMVVAATKTGMLARPATVWAVAQLAREGHLPNLVVDPVLVSSSGHALMEEGGVVAYREDLIAHATVVTPNLLEAAVLCGVAPHTLTTTDDLLRAARTIQAMGATYVVVKGGHYARGTVTAERAPDVVVGPSDEFVLDGVRIETPNDHGTGCSFAAATAARLALGDEPFDAIRFAKQFVATALAGSVHWRLGKGHGPIDHMGWGS
jgi:hydroxymethylpyrimidine/phosphomethylpyrimidine kinase